MKRVAGDPSVDLVALIGAKPTDEQIVPIMDALVNDNQGHFQVNVPNRGAIEGIPHHVVVEVPAIVDSKGIQPVHVGSLPPKLMYGQILPHWLEMERELLAFKTGDRSVLLYDVLEHHQTRSYDEAVAVLDDLMHMPEVVKVEDWEKMPRISEAYRYPTGL
jgi:alpha-galactosidase/6-phospho-beta-glucosidase family protein